ncbi:hypothetical protein GN316_13975 [Xylophilus sp. Kf1]|nr:hypothetical protein [Xylophilus sp. Kf1]
MIDPIAHPPKENAMQPYFSRTALPAASSGASPGWPVAAGRATPGDAAPDAGVGLLQHRPGDDDPRQLDMRLGEDLQALLQIRPETGEALARHDSESGASAARHRATRAVQSTSDALRQAFLVARGDTAQTPSATEVLVGQYTALWHAQPIARSPDRDALMAARATAMLDALRRRGEPPALIEQVRAGIDAMRKASGVVEQRLALVHGRLDRPDAALQGRLAAAGLDVDAVRLGLYRAANALLCTAVRLAVRGEAVFTLIPGTEALLDMAMHAAEHPGETVPAAVRTAPETSEVFEAFEAPSGPAIPTPVDAAASVQPAAAAQPVTARTREALDLLDHFAAHWRSQLWQFTGTAEDAARLSMGHVDFRDMRTLASTFPCAVRMEQVLHRAPLGLYGSTVVRKLNTPVYPRGPQHFSTVSKATLNGREVVVQRDAATGRVSVRGGGQARQVTEFHTDATVEAAKLAMWTLIFKEAFVRSMPP